MKLNFNLSNGNVSRYRRARFFNIIFPYLTL